MSLSTIDRSEYLPSLTSVSLEEVYFRRAEISGIYFNVALPVDAAKSGREVKNSRTE